MIAQHSQKVRLDSLIVVVSRGSANIGFASLQDPREYLPFLRALRELPEFLQRHKIDDYLSRHVSALRNLSQAGPEHFEEALDYTKKHGLFGVALEAYGSDEEKYRTVLEANAEDLFEKSKYAEAGLREFAISSLRSRRETEQICMITSLLAL